MHAAVYRSSCQGEWEELLSGGRRQDDNASVKADPRACGAKTGVVETHLSWVSLKLTLKDGSSRETQRQDRASITRITCVGERRSYGRISDAGVAGMIYAILSDDEQQVDGGVVESIRGREGGEGVGVGRKKLKQRPLMKGMHLALPTPESATAEHLSLLVAARGCNPIVVSSALGSPSPERNLQRRPARAKPTCQLQRTSARPP